MIIDEFSICVKNAESEFKILERIDYIVYNYELYEA